MARYSRVFVAVGLALLGTAACSSCARVAGTTDASDGAIPDRTAPTDVRDTSPTDVPAHPDADAACDPRVTDGWSRLPFLCDCDLRVADDPAREEPPLQWLPCRDGRAGCLEMSTPWNTVPGTRAAGVAGAVTPTGVELSVLQFGRADHRLRWTAAPRDGTPFVVLDLPAEDTVVGRYPACFFMDRGFTTDAAALAIMHAVDGNTVEYDYLRGPYAPSPRWRERAAWMPPNEFGPIDTGPLTLAGDELVTNGGGFVFRSDPTTGRFRVLAAPGDVRGQRPCCAQALGPWVVFATWSDQLWAVDTQRAVRSLYGASDPAHPGTFVLDRDDTVYWFEASGLRDDGLFDRVELFRSALDRTDPAVHPRRVGRVPMSYIPLAVQAGAGRVGIFVPDRPVVLVVNADGSFWTIEPPPGETLYGVVYLTDAEVAVSIGAAAARGPRTVVRQRFDALGPPQPPLP